MSVVLDRPAKGTSLPSGPAPVVVRSRVRDVPDLRPVYRAPVYEPAPTPVIVRKRAKASPFEAVMTKTLLFAGFFIAAYVPSTLAGYYMVDKSRMEGIDAAARASAAVRSENEVQRRLDTLTSASYVETWALTHGFHPTDGLGQTSKVVNLDANIQ